MRATTRTVFVLLAVMIAGWPSPVAALFTDGTGPSVTKWEYRVLTKDQIVELGKKDLVAGLNSLGEEGWELAAIESGFVFKRPKYEKNVENLRRRVTLAEADVARQRERTDWSERMVRRGFLSPDQLQFEKDRLQDVEKALENARRELKPSP